MANPPIPFPPLDAGLEDWNWPEPPFAWNHVPPPGDGVAQPCRIETHGGATLEGLLAGFDAFSRNLRIRSVSGGPELLLPFARFRRLTLTVPLQALPAVPGAPKERVPAAALERDYQLQAADGLPPLTGRTAGHVQAPEGMYLFTPVDDERSLVRVFVPATAYTRAEFGASAEELAQTHWISTRTELLAAIARQPTAPVLRMGQALLDLGLVTQAHVDRALSQNLPDTPLGERLVAAGEISRSDLHTALAHKMGYPLVNLACFPIEPAAVSRIPLRTATRLRALPLTIDGDRLIVAVDRPSRTLKLRDLQGLTRLKVVPVLARKGQLLMKLAELQQKEDVWATNVAARPEFFDTVPGAPATQP